MRQREPRVENSGYLDWIRMLPCVVCGDNVTVEAAHVSYGDPMVLKRGRGLGEKADDRWALPMCGKHHREQHDAGNEVRWWKFTGLDPVKIALALYVCFLQDDYERAEAIALRRT